MFRGANGCLHGAPGDPMGRGAHQGHAGERLPGPARRETSTNRSQRHGRGAGVLLVHGGTGDRAAGGTTASHRPSDGRGDSSRRCSHALEPWGEKIARRDILSLCEASGTRVARRNTITSGWRRWETRGASSCPGMSSSRGCGNATVSLVRGALDLARANCRAGDLFSDCREERAA